MKLSELIRKRRLELNMTQEQLANAVYVTPQAVSLWENTNKSKKAVTPGIESIKLLAEVLKINREELLRSDDFPLPAFTVKEQFFSVDNMCRKLKEFAQKDGLEETDRAIDYVQEKFEGQTRLTSAFTEESVPKVIHPYIMTCQAHALGIKDDEVLATALLHDVVEDTDVTLEDLPFSEGVKEAVGLLSKTEETDITEYFEKISENRTAAIVKIIDRCSNVSTMMLGFSDKKLIEYIEETETYIFPLMEKTRKKYPEYYDAVYLLKYQILSLLGSAKVTMLRVYKHSIE